MVLMVASDGLQFFARSLAWFGADLVLQGIAVSSLQTAGQVMVTRAFDGPTQTRSLTVWSTANFISYATGLFIAGLATTGPGWRSAYLFHGGLSVVAAFAALLLPRIVSPPHPEANPP